MRKITTPMAALLIHVLREGTMPRTFAGASAAALADRRYLATIDGPGNYSKILPTRLTPDGVAALVAHWDAEDGVSGTARLAATLATLHADALHTNAALDAFRATAPTAPRELAHPMDSDPFAGLPDNGVDPVALVRADPSLCTKFAVHHQFTGQSSTRPLSTCETREVADLALADAHADYPQDTVSLWGQYGSDWVELTSLPGTPAEPTAEGYAPSDGEKWLSSDGLAVTDGSELAEPTAESVNAPLWEALTDWARTYDRLHALSTYSDASDVGALGHVIFTDQRSLAWGDTVPEGSWDAAKDADGNPVLMVTLASYGEYSSTTVVDAANYRTLSELHNGRWAEGTGTVDPLLYSIGHTTRDGIGWMVRVGDENWSTQDLKQLLSLVDGIVDGVPFGGEDSVDAIERELQAEWWEGCGSSDVPEILCGLVGVESVDDLILLPATAERLSGDLSLVDLIKEAVWSVVNDGGYGVEWINEGACSRYPYANPYANGNGTSWVAEVGRRLFDMTTYGQCPTCGIVKAVHANGTLSRHTALSYRSESGKGRLVSQHCYGSGQKAAQKAAQSA